MTDPAPLVVAFAPSRVAAAAIAGGALATAALLAWLPGPPLLRAAAVTGLGVYAIGLLRRMAARSAPGAVVGLALGSDCNVTLLLRDGRRVDGVVHPDSYVSALLTTIVVRGQGARWPRTVAIVPDMLPPDDFRRLRVLLRLGRPVVATGRGTLAPPGAEPRR